ncbi:hypothetical protein [Acidianus ambivalens]|nr:hypothetical protein [Acidianus ambivalens]
MGTKNEKVKKGDEELTNTSRVIYLDVISIMIYSAIEDLKYLYH